MPAPNQVTSSSALQIPPQPAGSALLDSIRPIGVHAIINPKRGTEGSVPQQTPSPPPRPCGSAGAAGKACWGLDGRVVVLLVTVAGAVILLLLYRLLQLRHRLRLARARHALEYYGFYHSATYRLQHPALSDDPPTKNGAIPDVAPPLQTVTSITLPPPPPLPVLPPPPLPPPPSRPPTPPVLPVTLSLPLPLPVIHTTPPSPHLSWGACSDADVYSRIGSFRPSRLSSLSGQSKVILFEHSSL